jgi:hypothetical protein
VILPLVLVSVVTACGGGDSSPASPSGVPLTKPSVDAPAEGAQLDSLRPTLTIVNTSSSGTRTYEFEISDNAATGPGNAFTTRTLVSPAVAEDPSGKTKVTIGQDLQPSTRYYWHARVVQGSSTSDWSEARSFKTKIGGFNRPGALFDPLVNGETIGTIGGSNNITWIPGQGIRLNDALAYVVYALPQVVLTGELSVEVTGLGPGGPCCKPRVFSILDQVGELSSSSQYSMNAQYRGVGGGPENGIAFKAIFGNNALGLEPNTAQRLASVYVLDPSKVYLWRAVWTRDTYRLIVSEVGGPAFYDFPIQSAQANWNPSRMFAFLGTDNGKFDPLDGTLRGITLRNLWVGSTPRPSSLGSATAPAP